MVALWTLHRYLSSGFFSINSFVQPLWEIPRHSIRSGQCKEKNETGMVVVGRVVQMFFLPITHAGRFQKYISMIPDPPYRVAYWGQTVVLTN